MIAVAELAFSVFKPANRTMYQVEWTDPKTGRRHRRSTRKRTERDAQRVAAKIIDEWLSRRGREGDEAWETFVESHGEEVAPSLALETRKKYATVFNAVDAVIAPRTMSDLTPRALSRLQAKWRAGKLSEESIRTYLAHLSKALRWAHSQGMLAELPAIERPQLAKKQRKAKGRPLAAEEFERMLAAVPDVVKTPAAVASWQRLLRGLWLSALRLSEALRLSWDNREGLRVDLSGDFPALLVPSYDEKGRRDRIIPLTPDFAALLRETPEPERAGLVFVLTTQRKREPSNMQYVSAVISRIGKKAGVIVGRYPASGKTKYASAHDLRRSFGRRWAGKVRNAMDLKTLMRHEDIRTTLAYYAHEDAADLAAALREFTDTSADTHVSDAPLPSPATPDAPDS